MNLPLLPKPDLPPARNWVPSRLALSVQTSVFIVSVVLLQVTIRKIDNQLTHPACPRLPKLGATVNHRSLRFLGLHVPTEFGQGSRQIEVIALG